ncbi:hypothetical protein [Streptomyces sp. MBT28]|uniref:hypothetical protein n=1 Tax=Streptomyces sp. MBT28 TaxID=1488357 RepID=UPI000619BAA1|nr:hypothetical protein [Streptomyces sp. MBT28]
MPKSRKRRTAVDKKRRQTIRRDFQRAMTMPGPRPKHPGYEQTCPTDRLVDEFGEEGADWLQETYSRPLTVAEFRLEQCIRKDQFVLDDPLRGPDTVTTESISKVLEMTAVVLLEMARQQGVLTDEQAREAAEIAAMGPMDHATEGVDVVRNAFQDGAFFLNNRDMWEYAEGNRD